MTDRILTNNVTTPYERIEKALKHLRSNGQPRLAEDGWAELDEMAAYIQDLRNRIDKAVGIFTNPV